MGRGIEKKRSTALATAGTGHPLPKAPHPPGDRGCTGCVWG